MCDVMKPVILRLSCDILLLWELSSIRFSEISLCLEAEPSFYSQRSGVGDNYLGMFQKFPNTKINYSHF